MSTYYIASLKHTHKGDEHIVWWGTNHCGYTPVLGERAGRYCYGEACELNDGRDCIAVPVEAVQKLMSPEPYFENRTGLHRWYDQRGPVVLNTLANWRALQAARLVPERGQDKPKPEVFRGKRRAIYSAGELEAAQTQAELRGHRPCQLERRLGLSWATPCKQSQEQRWPCNSGIRLN